MLPAITLDVEPTPGGLELLSTRLTAFGHEHDVPQSVVTRMVAVADDVADILANCLEAPPVARLQADADIGLEDAQLVLIAADHRLPERYASMRGRLKRIGVRCDRFATQLTASAEVQVWACFRLRDATNSR